MVRELELALSPEIALDALRRENIVVAKLGIERESLSELVILKRSIDARKKKVVYRMRFAAYINEDPPEPEIQKPHYQHVSNAKRVIIVGSGPGGLFAALRFLELGLKPVILERGKDVSTRRKDLNKLQNEHLVHPDSNYCFGEGGAGTYSDGKLYTRSKKRGDLKRILSILVSYGATKDITIDAHPHIGTNKLPKIIAKMRENILQFGGEFHFETRVEDILIKSHRAIGVVDQQGHKFEGEGVVLATGHSARDIYYLLRSKGLSLETKAFAMGVRIEHPQRIIDSIQYHCGPTRDRNLPSAAYSLVHQVKDRGVYSFCMCPGGFVVPAATAQEEIVVNGMSTSTRDSRFANSGVVVSVLPEDLIAYKKHDVFAGLEYQKALEREAWIQGGKTQAAPAQRMVDFVNGRFSNQGQLNDCSYIPGITASAMHKWMPKDLRFRLQQGLSAFGKKMKGYYTNEAQILGVESRTSSPIKIPRDPVLLEHPDCQRLYPCGEGAGYAGGIISAAMDGERCAEALAKKIIH